MNILNKILHFRIKHATEDNKSLPDIDIHSIFNQLFDSLDDKYKRYQNAQHIQLEGKNYTPEELLNITVENKYEKQGIDLEIERNSVNINKVYDTFNVVNDDSVMSILHDRAKNFPDSFLSKVFSDEKIKAIRNYTEAPKLEQKNQFSM
jgi:hypothetical protein